MSIKDLAIAVLQGNQREPKSFLALKPRKPERHLGKPEVILPQWQHDLCTAHAMFNGRRGGCHLSFDDCLLTQILEAGGNIQSLMGVTIGQGIKTDNVINLWRESGESTKELMNKPLWFICQAESIASSQKLSRNLKNKGLNDDRLKT